MIGLGGALHEQGHQVCAIGTGNLAASEAADWGAIETYTTPTVGPAQFAYSPAMPQVIADSKPEVLHQHGLWVYPSVAGTRWGRRHAQQRLISPHGMLDPWALQTRALKKRLAYRAFERDNLMSARCLHALVAEEAAAIRALGLATPVAVIPNGVERPAGQTPLPEPLAEQIGTSPYVLYLGRIHGKKNLGALLGAWHRFAADLQPGATLQLVLAGFGAAADEAKLREQIAQAGRGDCHFIGTVYGQQKLALLSNAQALVLPSHSEGLPMVVLEAWAHGLPVLMTPHCNLPIGFTREAAIKIGVDPDTIAAGLHDLAALGDEGRQLMGQRGSQLIDEEFTWPQVARKFARLYAWIANGGQQPDDLFFAA